MEKYYAIRQVGTNKFIAYDMSSGGYPWVTDDFESAFRHGGVTRKPQLIPQDSYLYGPGIKYEIVEVTFNFTVV